MVRADPGLQQVPERREGTRYLVQIPVQYGSTGSSRGTLVDISATGASVEGPPPQEEVGQAFVLELDCFGTPTSIGLGVWLVRLNEQGFAVQFTETEPFLRALLKIALLHLEQDRAPAHDGPAGWQT